MPTLFISGAAKRIGKAIAIHFAQQGWKIVLHFANSKAEAIDTASTIEAFGGQVHLIQIDFLQPSSIIDSLADVPLPVDLLINNAGLFVGDQMTNFNYQNLSNHLAVNVEAPAILHQWFLHQLPANAKGNIINMLDYCIFKAPHNFFSYCLSKNACHSLTKLAARQLAPRVRVNAVALGQLLKNEQQSEANFAAAQGNTLLKQAATMTELLETLEFILKIKSMTGQVITLDGGMHLADAIYQ